MTSDLPPMTSTMFVVGGYGYVGWRVVDVAIGSGDTPTVVSRDGDSRGGRTSISWDSFLGRVGRLSDPYSVVWLLDGAKHDEIKYLSTLVPLLTDAAHVVLVSTCTVYGDANGGLCDESAPQRLGTPNAELKATGERLVSECRASACVLRFGALYGVDQRGVRADRVQKWVTQAAESGVVVVPEPRHWRGWLHRDQAARALYRAAVRRTIGVFNVASANLTFGEAAGMAAGMFGATARGDGKPDVCNYKVDASAARVAGILDEQAGEDLRSTIDRFAADR